MGENRGTTSLTTETEQEHPKAVRKPARRRGGKPPAVPVPIAEETFGVRLRRLRTEAGLSITEFAERTKYSKGYISKIETGAKPPNPELARCCDEALGASGALAELAAEAGGPAEAVAAVAAGMGSPDATDLAEPTAEAPETTGTSERETLAAESDVTPVEPTHVALAEAFGHDEAPPHIPTQNDGVVWPAEPPPVEAAPDGTFAEWSAPPEESSAGPLPSLADDGETTTEPVASAADEPPVPSTALALRDDSIPAQSPVAAEPPSGRRRLILAGLAALLVAVAVAGAFLLLHLAGDERPPTDGRVHPAVPAQQHGE